MQEAARFRLLRLGSTLRGADEELGRFTRQDPAFSRRRLSFFLNRAWLLSRGIAHALHAADETEYDRLAWSPPHPAAAGGRGRLPGCGQEGRHRRVRRVRVPAAGDGRRRSGPVRAAAVVVDRLPDQARH